MEDRMRNVIISRIVLIIALGLVSPVIEGCGSKMEGTYTNTGGMVTLDLKSGGKATFTMMGETVPCNYKAKGDKINLDCSPKGEKDDFTVHNNGSLTETGFIETMKTSK